MKNKIIYATLFCVAMVLAFNTAEAQNRRIGTASASELLIPVGGRDLAMGGSSLASSYGVEAIYWNPAGIGRLKRDAETMFSQMTYIADIDVSYGAVVGRFSNFGVVGFSIKALNIGDIPLTTSEDPDGEGGKLFSPTYMTLGLSYGRELTDAIAAGFTIKVVSETIDRVASTGYAFDFGIQYHGLVGVSGLQLGVAVKNIGPQMKFDGSGLLREAIATGGVRPQQQYKSEAASFELPSVVEIGLGYQGTAAENMVWSVNSSFTNNNLYLDEYRFGGEVGVTMEALRLFARGGFETVPQAETADNIFGGTFGVGLGYAATGIDISVDYAYRSVQYFDANNVISFKLGF